ncbi:M23 family metallopeptidase [Yoonia sp.]|uniref:M23 family metallopeptidase n=1 Tax=Yoonia sp. TaxID=2212373 RepID=UPI0040487196
MKIRYWTMGLVLAGSVSGLAVALSNDWDVTPVPEALANVGEWAPRDLQELAAPVSHLPAMASSDSWVPPVVLQPFAPNLALADEVLPEVHAPSTAWSRKIASGETLDTLLKDAGLNPSVRAEVALALGAEYDLRRLRPGDELTVVRSFSDTLQSVTLGVDDGVIIEATFGDTTTTRTLNPDPESMILAGETMIESSLFMALEEAAIPARFAVDLAQMLGGTVDFRRELKGGETLQVLWREARLGDERIGQPEITFAALNVGETLYEVVWPEDGTGRATIYVDGEVLRVFAQPVDGARLSSVFGQRRHPVYGNVRMHTGVDFAAAKGTPVHATAPGRIAFIGWRGGYGRVVEIAHGTDTKTRYAHLSGVTEGMSLGQRVLAGDVIGNVGATGTATGPNLHYEVLIDGRPTDPLSDDRLATATADDTQDALAATRLEEARLRLETHLAALVATGKNERL